MCHIQFKPLSLTDNHSLSSSHRSRFPLIIPESSSCCALMWLILYPTSGNWCSLTSLTSLFSPYLPLPIILQQSHLKYQHCPSLSLTQLCKISLSQFFYWRLCFNMNEIPRVILLLLLYYSSCSSSVSYSAAWGQRERERELRVH